jgi:hypothetical protein
MHPSRFRRDAIPELIEMPVIEERDRLDDFCVPHLKVPGVRITIRFSIPYRRFGIEQDDHRIAIGLQAADYGNQRLGHAGIKRINHLVYKFLLAFISLSQGR